MGFPGTLTRRDGQHPPRPPVLPRLQAVIHGPDLDLELAAGMRPSMSPSLQARADHLMRPRVRRRIAFALNRAVDDAFRPVRPVTSQAPLHRDAVRHCAGEIRRLAAQVATLGNPAPRGIAIAFQLAFDGGGAMFRQPGDDDGAPHLANTLQTADRALRVSPDL